MSSAQRNGDVEESKDKVGCNLSGGVVGKGPSKQAVNKGARSDGKSDMLPGTDCCPLVDESLEDVLAVPTLEPCEMPERCEPWSQ